eukprot:14532189-Alexandrium_andersonii.AAC.1
MKTVGRVPDKWFMLIFEQPFDGEPITAPHLRVAPLVKGELDKLLLGALHFRRGCYQAEHIGNDELPTGLQPGDMFVVRDGGRHGNVGKYTKGLRATENSFSKKSIYTHMDLASMKARRDRVSGAVVLHQMQQTHVFANQ